MTYELGCEALAGPSRDDVGTAWLDGVAQKKTMDMSMKDVHLSGGVMCRGLVRVCTLEKAWRRFVMEQQGR